MKKSLLALAVLGAFAGAASAQSSVTIYGSLDLAVTKGNGGGQLFFVTDDCRKTYAELKAKGISFTQEPEEQPYGIDCALRDPFGNRIRIAQTRK